MSNYPPPYEEIEMPGDYAASYHCHHLKTDQHRDVKRTFLSRRHFLEALNRWNRTQPGTWIYYESFPNC
jgi:hypothetical protein